MPPAVEKAVADAKKHLVRVSLIGTTFPHATVAEFRSSQVKLIPAAPGTGIIAGAAVRAVLEAAGVRDVLTKALGSKNPMNLAKATFEGLRLDAHQAPGRRPSRSGGLMNLQDVRKIKVAAQEAPPRRPRPGLGLGDHLGSRPQGRGPAFRQRDPPALRGRTDAALPPPAEEGLHERRFKLRYHVVNVGDLDKRFEAGAIVDLEALKAIGLAPKKAKFLKILGYGDLTKTLTVSAHAVSDGAREEDRGGLRRRSSIVPDAGPHRARRGVKKQRPDEAASTPEASA